MEKYDVIVVGGGIAGLTSCAYLCRAGFKVLLCEKEKEVGGLVKSFYHQGFTFDCGIRAIEVSTGVLSMLNELNIDVEFLKNDVTTGIGDNMIEVCSEDSIEDYQKLLTYTFPDEEENIKVIIKEMKKIMQYMDNMYEVDNPLFRDLKDRDYVFNELLPWLWKFLKTQNQCDDLQVPVYEYLFRFTNNPKLVDMIGQHFFKDSSAFFALSYFNIHCDYMYPKGGTGRLTKALSEYITKNGGFVQINTSVVYINPEKNVLKDQLGAEYSYKSLVWACDTKRLYDVTDTSVMKSDRKIKAIYQRMQELEELRGGDSVLSLYAMVDLPPEYFKEYSSAHCFYTPQKEGILSMACDEQCALKLEKEALFQWCKEYFEKTTYEISIPVLRDASLAPKGKTGLIIGALMSYDVVKRIYDMGAYDEFKEFITRTIVDIMEYYLYPDIHEAITKTFVSTPLSIQRITGNTDGAITGWAFTNNVMPCINKTISIAKSTKTAIKNVFQAGQWAFSPSGLPTAIITGKLASIAAEKYAKKHAHKKVNVVKEHSTTNDIDALSLAVSVYDSNLF